MRRGIVRFLVILAGLIGVFLCVLAFTQKDREIRTEIVIDAPPEEVWRVLAATAEYPAWNPFIVSLKGTLGVDETLKITIRPPGGSEMSFTPRVLVATPNRELAWRGSLPIPGLFNGEHRFRLEPAEGGRTRFLHSEKFTGLLVGSLTTSALDRTEAGFVEMNQALKIQTERRR